MGNTPDDELDRLQQRMHRISDLQQTQALRLGEHGVLIKTLQHQLESLQMHAATKEQLSSSVAVITNKIDSVKESIDPMRRALYWAVALIIGAFIAALIGLVLDNDARASRRQGTVIAPSGGVR